MGDRDLQEVKQELTAVIAGQQRLMQAVLDAIDTGSPGPLSVARESLRAFLAEHRLRVITRSPFDAYILADARARTATTREEIANRPLGCRPLPKEPQA